MHDYAMNPWQETARRPRTMHSATVRDVLEHRQPGGLDDVQQAAALVEFDAVAIDDNGVGIARRQTPELGIDQPKAPHHIFRDLERAVAEANVFLDRRGTRGENNSAIRAPGIAN